MERVGGRAPPGPDEELDAPTGDNEVAMEMRCSSCGRELVGRGATTFLCPSCGETTIGRDAQCRDQSVPYRCTRCGFQGP